MVRPDHNTDRILDNDDALSTSGPLITDPGSKAPRNIVTVESPYGLRTFALRDGDVTLAPDPVLVVPTHANEELEPDGRVLRTAEARFGVTFTSTERIVSGRQGVTGTHRLRSTRSLAGREILMVRIPGRITSDRVARDNPLELLSEALWSLFGSTAALELRTTSLNSMAMPLLAGTRGYEVRDLLKVILDHSLGWLRVSRYMSAVNFYVIAPDAMNEWNDAMDAVLGRHSIDAAQHALVGALRSEILSIINSERAGRLPSVWRENLSVLDSSLRSRQIPLERVAVDGRRFAELLVFYLQTKSTDAPPKGTLHKQLETLEKQHTLAPWMIAHLQCLKSFGNAGAHSNQSVSYDPPSLHDDDLVGILASLQRVLDFGIRKVSGDQTHQ